MDEGKKIRVALLTDTIDGRKAKGTAVVARKSVEALLKVRDRFDLTYLHYEKNDDAIYGHDVRDVILPKFGWDFLNRRFARLIYYFVTTEDRYDIIQWFQARLYPFFWLAPARYIVATLHGAGDLTPDGRFILSRFVFNWTTKLFNRKVSMVIAGSEYAKKDIVKKYGFEPAHVTAINFGVDASYKPVGEKSVEAVKQKYKLPEKFFLGMARHIPTKNVSRTIEAFDRFCAASKIKDMHFVHVGAEDNETPALKQLIEKSLFKDRIHLVSYVEQRDLSSVYSAAYALVFPLLNEGFSLPPLEAMASGTPAVISETAAPEITEDDAVLVDPYDVNEIAVAMRELAEKPERRDRYARAGFAKVQEFTWERMGDKLVLLYQKLMTGQQ